MAGSQSQTRSRGGGVESELESESASTCERRRRTVGVDMLRVPVPLYRHAAPSAPWPWMNFNHDAADVVPLSPGVASETEDACQWDLRWRRYPQSLFGNWTPEQVGRCRMFDVIRCETSEVTEVFRVDVFRGGVFEKATGGGEDEGGKVWEGSGENDAKGLAAFGEYLEEKRPEQVRLRALFVERMSSGVMQMLGTRYNVEPFFFSSSANWIPSRYQEDPQPGKGDHITIVLPFVRVTRDEREPDTPTFNPYEGGPIDTQAPLHISGNKILLQDLLAIHMVRTTTSDTIISYHPNSKLRQGSAQLLQSLVQRTGDSVYWSKLYQKSKDPTLVFVAILWHAIYAWDEAFEVLYDHLNKTLEAEEIPGHSKHTRELHKVRAHLICYWQLLRDFRKSVEFLQKTPNPAMDADSVTDRERRSSARVLKLEIETLLTEIERLDKQRAIMMDRLKNSISLAFATVKSEETNTMHRLTAGTLRDSATMKLISYLTLVFLPPYFLAGVFRMNVQEINPNATERLSHYILGTIIFTVLTAWLGIALQNHSSFHPGGRDFVRRLAWPVFYVYEMVRTDLSTGQRPPPRRDDHHRSGVLTGCSDDCMD